MEDHQTARRDDSEDRPRPDIERQLAAIAAHIQQQDDRLAETAWVPALPAVARPTEAPPAPSVFNPALAAMRRQIDGLAAGRTTETADDPWDAETADALAAIYWGERPVSKAAAAPSAPPAIDIARHIDAIAADLGRRLNGVATVDEVVGIADRLKDLDLRLDVVADAARTAGATAGAAVTEGLRELDNDIANLSLTLETLTAKAERVSGIEQTVSALARDIDARLSRPSRQPLDDDDVARMAKATADLMAADLRAVRPMDLTDETVARLAEKLAADVAGVVGTREPVRHSDDDLRRVAESIARVLVQRVTAAIQATPPATAKLDDNALIDVRQLLEAGLTERRQSDEQVSGMLDTMQQALIGLLDRMDSIERQTADAVAAANAAASAVEQLPETFAAAMPAPQPLPSPPHELAHAGPAPLSSEPVPPSMPAALPTPSVAHAPEQASLSAFATRPPQPAEIPALSERTKEDMIASARRAAAQASQRQAEQAQQGQPAKSRGKSSAKGRGLSIAPMLNRRVLIAILAVVAATSAYMALTRKPAAPPAAPPKIEKGMPPGTVTPQKSGSLETDRNIRLSDAEADETVDEVQQASVAQPPGTSGMPGLVVQTTRPVSPLDMLRQREQDGFARLSAQLGPRAASSVAASGIEPVEPREAEPDRAAAAKDLPPASVGPQSLRIAARDGDPAAEFAVGSRLAEGRGVPQDIEQAAIWYQRAAQKGFAIAQYRLATYYERGIGVSKDLGRALVWYRRAAEQGNVKAMHNLGVLLSSRDLGAPDYAAAAPLFQKAADTGLRDSQYNLAVLFESGLGVEQDFARAYRYLALAARQGDAQAVKRLAPVRAKLAPADAAAIDEQLAQWRPVPADPVANDPIVAGETWKARVPATPAG